LKHLVVKSTIGYHPDSCNDGEITEENIQQKISDLKKLYESNKEYVVAIGECGIDTYYPGTETSLPLQKKLFTLQCDLAKELDLPLMVHIRKDFDSAFEILQNYRDMTVYIHCWGFGSEEVKRLQVAGSKL
jgi:TatD DNase family protein